jgi:hypothetical protein
MGSDFNRPHEHPTVNLPDHLDLIAAAPAGIQKLRGLILELAVRGKLVPQDPNDEPASELLKRIAKEQARLAEWLAMVAGWRSFVCGARCFLRQIASV